MKIVYAQEALPETITKSIFLVGPTPRSDNPVDSWRPKMLEILASSGYDGHVFVPEPREGKWNQDYDKQVEWEKLCLEVSDRIIAWVPRDLKTMPAFTTNVEFGRYVNDGKLIYGRPDGTPKNQYLDWLYKDCTGRDPSTTMEELVDQVTGLQGMPRSGGCRYVPLDIYNKPMFADWLAEQHAVGNRLDKAKVLWKFVIPKINFLFSYVLWVRVWIEEEQRYKENEYIFSRSDISTILPFWLDVKSNDLLATKVVLIKEFRSPVRNSSGFVHELPGGSSFKKKENALEIASDELKEETGLEIPANRFKQVFSRQLASTLSTHKSVLFSVALTDEELEKAEELAASKQAFGVAEDTERTYVEVKTLRDIFKTDEVDWSMIGMIFNGISNHNPWCKS